MQGEAAVVAVAPSLCGLRVKGERGEERGKGRGVYEVEEKVKLRGIGENKRRGGIVLT